MIIKPLLIGTFACFGYGLLCHIPKKTLFIAALVGGISWTTYSLLIANNQSPIMACFIATGIVAILADILARIMKEAATLFAIPGIIPLVPGGGLYFTMLEIINNNYDAAVSEGTLTFFIAGSIALSLLVFGAFIRIMHFISRSIIKTETYRSKF